LELTFVFPALIGYFRHKMKKIFFRNDFSNDDPAEEFFNFQISSWNFAKANYSALEKAQFKKFVFPNATVFVQHNPARAISTFAETARETIADRKCFLCDENLYPEQIGLAINENFTMLVNPYPIVSRHFTIKFNKHVPQKISDNFGDFLASARFLGEKYFVLYNGPDCGASVPEHRHFQAGIASELPIINEIKAYCEREREFIERRILTREEGKNIRRVYDGLRAYYLLCNENEDELTANFFELFRELERRFPSERETKINLLLFVYRGKLTLGVFPRKNHRPQTFYDEDGIKISPATLDYGGLMVAPRKEDFEKIDKKGIKKIFGDVAFEASELFK
jgi:hypothetical protein